MVNTDTLAVEAEADVLIPGPGFLSALVLGPQPPRVETLSAAVNGSSVTLSWTIAASQTLATPLVIEAGSAPGLANLARFVLPPGEMDLQVPNVPPGTYFVRVRSADDTGKGSRRTRSPWWCSEVGRPLRACGETSRRSAPECRAGGGHQAA